MQILNLIEKHNVKFRHTLGYKLTYDHKSVTICDQEEACKNPCLAYRFAYLKIPGTDITKCQKAACIQPCLAYKFARDIQGVDIEYCRKACDPDQYWLRILDRMIAEKNASININREASG